MTFQMLLKIFWKKKSFSTLTASKFRFFDVSRLFMLYQSFHEFERFGAVRTGEAFVGRLTYKHQKFTQLTVFRT